jgi:hypothetical protein
MPPPVSLERTMVLLAGFRGAGKLAVARALVEGSPNTRLVDDGLYLDPIFKVVPNEQPAWVHVAAVRDVVLSAIRQLAPPEWGFVFTNVLLEGDANTQPWFEDVRVLAEARGSLFVPVRLVNQEVSHGKVLDSGHPATLTLDTTKLTVDQTAGVVLRHVARLKEMRGPHAQTTVSREREA